MLVQVECPRCHERTIRVRTHESHQGVVAACATRVLRTRSCDSCDEARQSCQCWLTTEELWETERAAIREAQDREEIRRAIQPPTWEVALW